jgi:hypothetical protein
VSRAPGTPKTGGRSAGTPNKRTRKLTTFLDDVFAKAMADPTFRDRLVAQIVTLTIDTKLLVRLLEYTFGAPPKEHKHDVGDNLAALIAGITVTDEEDEDADLRVSPDSAGP